MTATPECPHFGACGGCSLQHSSYAEQLKMKEDQVRACLAGLPVKEFLSLLPSPEPFFYRNKMEYSFGDERDIAILNGEKPDPALAGRAVHLGLHPKGRFAIVTPTPECKLLSNDANVVLNIVARWATEHKVSTYVRKTGQGILRHLVIREGKNTGERMVNLVARSELPALPVLAERLKKATPAPTTFLWTVHDGASDVARAEETRILWGEGAIQERFGRVRVRVTPFSFAQTNTHAAEGMMNLLRGWLEEDLASLVTVGPRLLADLYCGSGVIGLNLADLFDDVVGIEINAAAIEDARATAQANGITNVRFVAQKAEEGVGQPEVLTLRKCAAVIVDPPRAGLNRKVVEALNDAAPPLLYYVSCNPETLARDLEGLSSRYSILAVRPMDFFPQTLHVETAVRLRRK